MDKPLQIGVHVETSLAAGRDILAGVYDYIGPQNSWVINVYPHHVSALPPAWYSQWGLNGIIARFHNQQIFESIRSLKIPAVDVLGVCNHGFFPLVHTNDDAIGKMAAEHFLQRGFSSYGFMGIDDQAWSIQRRDSFISALMFAGKTCSALTWSSVYENNSPLHERAEKIIHWLQTLQLPAAIFVSQDAKALVLRDIARFAGFIAGVNLAILGVDNDLSFCDVPSPKLSSIDPDHKKIGYQAAALLDQMIRGTLPPKAPVLVKPKMLITRESTDFLGVSDDGLKLAIDFIRHHAADGITLDSVANAAGMSRSVAQRKFRETLGITIHDYILQEKSRRAIRMIQETDQSIEAIAEASGFRYVQSLNKALQRLYGQSARNYRMTRHNQRTWQSK